MLSSAVQYLFDERCGLRTAATMEGERARILIESGTSASSSMRAARSERVPAASHDGDTEAQHQWERKSTARAAPCK